MNDQIDDQKNKEHHNDDKIAALYKQGSVETPASHINEKILQHAKSRSNNVIKLPLRQILNIISSSRTLAVAAVLVISVSVILQIQFDHPNELTPTTPEQLLERQLFSDDEPDYIDLGESSTEPALSSEMQSEQAPTTNIVSPSMEKSPPTAPGESKRESVTTSAQKKSKQAHPKPGLNTIEPEKRREYEELRKQRLKSLQQKEQQAISKRRQSERARKVQRNEAQSSAITKREDLSRDNCPLLTNRECMSSLNCSLSFIENAFVCNASTNACENNFKQSEGTEQQCALKESCEYIEGQCECDSEGLCTCVDDIPPSCIHLSEGEVNEAENENEY